MSDYRSKISPLLEDLKNLLKNSDNLSSLEEISMKYLGKKGILNSLFALMASLPLDERKNYGAILNDFKTDVSLEISKRKNDILLDIDANNSFDFSKKIENTHGSVHLISRTIHDIIQTFVAQGFEIQDTLEVEWEHFAFETLNIPSSHPARDDVETFYMEANPDPNFGRMLLTPHTSSSQVRHMQQVKNPPIRCITISKTYRPNYDATHTPMFHQFEGLVVDENISIAHLASTIDSFVKSFFGQGRGIRLRPYKFRFTEPSFEIDITCDVCGGTGHKDKQKCRICKSGYLELGGAGMVHQAVLQAGGIDPKKYSGWAFGFGVERVAMMRSGTNLSDIRLLYQGDLRFLQQM